MSARINERLDSPPGWNETPRELSMNQLLRRPCYRLPKGTVPLEPTCLATMPAASPFQLLVIIMVLRRVTATELTLKLMHKTSEHHQAVDKSVYQNLHLFFLQTGTVSFIT